MPSEPDITIQGLGLVTPLGTSPWSTYTALLSGKTTADRLEALTPDVVTPTAIARATAACTGARFAAPDPALVIAEAAARQALAGSTPPDLHLVIGCSKGAFLSLLPPEHAPLTAPPRSPEAAALGPFAFLARHLRTRLNIPTATTHSITSACASSLAALHHARHLLLAGDTSSVLVVTAEAALHPVLAETYARLGVLAPTDPVSAHRCTPLDSNRAGFTLCECAAAVLLTRTDLPPDHALPKLAKTAVATEPFHLLKPPDIFRATQALTEAVRIDAPLAMVHPHATGTQDNDAAEIAAFEQALGQDARGLPVYASKGALGHPLGSSGMVNLVIACIAARALRRPPMPWLAAPLESTFQLGRASVPLREGQHILMSAGFGGHAAAASILVRKPR